MSYNDPFNRLALQQQELVTDTSTEKANTQQKQRYTALMALMQFEEHDITQVDQWLMLDSETDSVSASGSTAWKIH